MKNAVAAKKAFIYNRVGDFAFLVAIFTVFNATGSLNFEVILANLDAFSDSAVFWAAFLMFIGATGKSAQIPLFVWLPEDRKSTRLNSSHVAISYAVFCLKKKN